jgi:hypothetical protein
MSNKNSDRTDNIQPPYEIIHALPKHYFERMNAGSKLAKQGEFEKAAEEFNAARKEVGQILRQLLELKKSPTAQMWQFFGILWAFKLIKSVFYWLLALSETADTPENQKRLLLTAMGAQQIGADMIPAFENLHQSFKGVDRDLLPMLGEAIRNFENRQQILRKALEQQDMDLQI